MRVLYLIDWLRPGVGVPEMLGMLVEPYRRAGVELVVAAMKREPDDLGATLERAGVELVAMPDGFARRQRRAWRLARIVRRRGIDVIHANEVRCIEIALGVARWTPRTPVIGHLRVTGNVRSGSGRRERFLAENHGRLAALVAVSAAVLADYRDATGLADHGRVILNGRRLDAFAASAPDVPDVHTTDGVPTDRPLLVTAGSLIETKDHATLLDALARLRDDGVDAFTALLGAGPLRPALEAHAARCGLDDRTVRFFGYRDDVRRFLDAAAVYVSTSVREGLPGAVIEAQAAGVPCVVTSCGGPEEVVADGATGLVVPPRDPAATAAAIARLLASPADRDRMAAAARERAGHFRLERMVDEWVALYQEVVARRRNS